MHVKLLEQCMSWAFSTCYLLLVSIVIVIKRVVSLVISRKKNDQNVSLSISRSLNKSGPVIQVGRQGHSLSELVIFSELSLSPGERILPRSHLQKWKREYLMSLIGRNPSPGTWLPLGKLPKEFSRLQSWDFPGGPVAKTLSSQCEAPGFNPWSRELNPTCHN